MDYPLNPTSGVLVRLYRIGHGDCVLLTFAGEGEGPPVNVLVDCGYLGGSRFVQAPTHDIIDDLKAATGGRLDVVVVTHEHADHVAGFAVKKSGKHRFAEDFTIGRLWLPWTEDPEDDDANQLREDYDDVLLTLLTAHGLLGAAGEDTKSIDPLLELELGTVAEASAVFGADGKKIEGVTNKKAIKVLQEAAEDKPPLYLQTHGAAYPLPGTAGVRVYALGPPRDKGLLRSMDPEAGEGYSTGHHLVDPDLAFALAHAPGGTGASKPFAPRFELDEDEAKAHYGDYIEAAGSERWQAIDGAWLGGAGALALRLNHYTNNTSLVLAFELPQSGQVLLLTGDAQRGSWYSWSRESEESTEDVTWPDANGEPVTARELLSRVVLYKVGHHGSHNATLAGEHGDVHPSLSWMGEGEHPEQLVALLPAHATWALAKKRWVHPLPSILEDLLERTRGRVLRADAFDEPVPDLPAGPRADFASRTEYGDLCVQYWIPDAG